MNTTDGVQSPCARLERLLNGRTPYGWARKVGISQGSMSRLMEGNFPSVDRLLGALEAESISLTWWLTGQGQPYIVHNPPGRLSRIMQDTDATLIWLLQSGVGVSAVLERPIELELPPGSSSAKSYQFQKSDVIGWPLAKEDLEYLIGLDKPMRTITLPASEAIQLMRGEIPWWKIRQESKARQLRAAVARRIADERGKFESTSDAPKGWDKLNLAQRKAVQDLVKSIASDKPADRSG